MEAARLCDVAPDDDWKLGGFVAANLYDQRALLGVELAKHPLSVLWLAANVKRTEQARAVHEWVSSTSWGRQPATRGLIQFVNELRDTIYNEIPQGVRIAELARLDDVVNSVPMAPRDEGAAALAAYRDGKVYWATDADVLALLALATLGAPLSPTGRRLCRGAPPARPRLEAWVRVCRARHWDVVGWGPLGLWRAAVCLPRGSVAQFATMVRPDWAEAWTRLGYPCNRQLVRLATAWRTKWKPPVECEAEEFIQTFRF